MDSKNTYIIENQLRADGVVNHTTTSRTSFASGLSYYYERKSKMVVNTEFPQVALAILDANLNIIEQCIIDTQYVAETE